jgi:hypothetical protein
VLWEYGAPPGSTFRHFNLRALCVDVLVVFPIMIEISIFIDETWHLVSRRHRAPPVIHSLARQRKVQPKVCVGMRFRVVGNLRKPRAGHHQASGIDGPNLLRLDRGSIDGVSFTEVVCVNNDQLRAGEVTQTLGQILA